MADQDFNIKVVTTADTSGIRQTSVGLAQLQKQAEQQFKAAEQAGYELGRALRVVAGGAVIAGGYQFVSQLRAAATEIDKISAALDKEGAQLVANAQKFSEMAKFATTNADVIKIGEGALKGVEAAHKRLLDESGKELSIWQKIADVWAGGFKNEGPIAEAKRLAEEQAALNYQLERQNAIREISESIRTKETLAAKNYTQQIEYLNQKIAQQEAIQRRVGIKNIEEYLKAGAAAENYRKILAGVNAEAEKAAKAAEKRAAEEQSFKDNAYKSASRQVKETLVNEEAMRRAQYSGRAGDYELYKKTVDAFKRGMTPGEREEYEALTKPEQMKNRPAAGVGESQAMVDQIEKNRRAAEAIQRPEAWKPDPTTGGYKRDDSEIVRKLQDLIEIWR